MPDLVVVCPPAGVSLSLVLSLTDCTISPETEREEDLQTGKRKKKERAIETVDGTLGSCKEGELWLFLTIFQSYLVLASHLLSLLGSLSLLIHLFFFSFCDSYVIFKDIQNNDTHR